MSAGPTPLVPLAGRHEGIYAKVEYLHPSGSMKHRSIPRFLEQLVRDGQLRRGQRVVVRSAGSAAVTTAWAGARLGLRVTAVLPPNVMSAVLLQLRWFGAQALVVPPDGAAARMKAFAEDGDVYVLAQANEASLRAHYGAVAREVFEQLGEARGFTVGIGTGLSVTGIARAVRSHGADAPVYGVEPSEAAIASGAKWAPHDVPGLAPPIPQPLLERGLLRDIVTLPSETAWITARDVARNDGLPLGPSSGLAVAAAQKLLAEGAPAPIVAVCACSIYDYLPRTAHYVR